MREDLRRRYGYELVSRALASPGDDGPGSPLWEFEREVERRDRGDGDPAG